MHMHIKDWLDKIGHEQNIFEVEDPKALQEAAAGIICHIINFDNVENRDELSKVCDLFQKEFHLDADKAKAILGDERNFKENIEKFVKVVRKQLGDDEVKKLQFMKMLNKFIIVDNCKDEDYCIFDRVKELLFDET